MPSPKHAFTLPLLFFLFASTRARNPFCFPENDVIGRDSLPESDTEPVLLLPSEDETAVTETNGEDPPKYATLSVKNPRRKKTEISYGDDVVRTKGFDREAFGGGVRRIPARWMTLRSSGDSRNYGFPDTKQPMSISKTLVLKGSDGEAFEVEVAVAMQSETIKNMFDPDCPGANIINLPNVTGEILAKVVKFCSKHVAHHDEPAPNAELEQFDSDFARVEPRTLVDLIRASIDLKIKSLQDFAIQRVADIIKGKTPEQIRQIFNIKQCDFTPEEEEEVGRENACGCH